jgi:hypothetical protein
MSTRRWFKCSRAKRRHSSVESGRPWLATPSPSFGRGLVHDFEGVVNFMHGSSVAFIVAVSCVNNERTTRWKIRSPAATSTGKGSSSGVLYVLNEASVQFR